jgi:hypothetical protein
MGKAVDIKTVNGLVPISKIKIGDLIDDGHNGSQRVLGVIYGEMDNAVDGDQHWHNEWYEKSIIRNGCEVWSKGQSTVLYNTSSNNQDAVIGMSLITETGIISVRDRMYINGIKYIKDCIIRDFTEIGYDRIHITYPFVESRLDYLSKHGVYKV